MTLNVRNPDSYYGLVVDTYNLFHPEGNINDAAFYKWLIYELQLLLEKAGFWGIPTYGDFKDKEADEGA